MARILFILYYLEYAGYICIALFVWAVCIWCGCASAPGVFEVVIILWEYCHPLGAFYMPFGQGLFNTYVNQYIGWRDGLDNLYQIRE